MYGLEAIAHYNGWAQAIIGAAIVMAGLSALSLAISQIHVLAEFFEKRLKSSDTGPSHPGLVTLSPKEPPALDFDQTVQQYQKLVQRLASPFSLQDLYTVCRQHDFRHPHQSIKMLREAGILQAVGNGTFVWTPDAVSNPIQN